VYLNKPKFVFGFHAELTHDSYNLLSTADDDVKNWIQWFEDEGHLNKTLLIMMADHGHRQDT
jgi:arylsulfatase A-like enzyme